MRNLQTKDIFSACRLLVAIGVKDDLRDLAMKSNSVKDIANQWDNGFDLVFGIVEKAIGSKAEKQWYEFFASIFECKPAEVEKMDPVEFIDKALEAADVEHWKSFFQRVSALVTK